MSLDKSYETTLKKYQKLVENEKKNSLDATSMNKIDLVQRQENYRKPVHVIGLTKGLNMQQGTVKPDGFVNPNIKITSGIPQLPLPLQVFNVLLPFSANETAVVIPNANMYAVKLLIVAPSSNGYPVADDQEDLNTNVDVTVKSPANGNIATPVANQPEWITPYSFLVTVNDDEMGAASPYQTSNVAIPMTIGIGTNTSSNGNTVDPSNDLGGNFEGEVNFQVNPSPQYTYNSAYNASQGTTFPQPSTSQMFGNNQTLTPGGPNFQFTPPQLNAVIMQNMTTAGVNLI
jgi:hypothetical protein